jgi:hypothetical protein
MKTFVVPRLGVPAAARQVTPHMVRKWRMEAS